jgi:hypothetical protein
LMKSWCIDKPTTGSLGAYTYACFVGVLTPAGGSFHAEDVQYQCYCP